MHKRLPPPRFEGAADEDFEEKDQKKLKVWLNTKQKEVAGSSAESVQSSSEEETEAEYTVERVVEKRVQKGKVSSNHSNKELIPKSANRMKN